MVFDLFFYCVTVKTIYYNFCFVFEDIFELGNTTKSRCFGVRVEAQAYGNKGGSRILKWGVNFCNNVREIKYYFNI